MGFQGLKIGFLVKVYAFSERMFHIRNVGTLKTLLSYLYLLTKSITNLQWIFHQFLTQSYTACIIHNKLGNIFIDKKRDQHGDS